MLGAAAWTLLVTWAGIVQAFAPAICRYCISGARATLGRILPGMNIEAEGHGGQVTFDGSFVTIHRKGFLARASAGKGEKRIPVRSITAVQWKPAGGMTNGFIQFTMPGGVEARGRAGRQTSSAVKDENSVVFTKAQMPAFEALRSAVETALA